MDGLKRKLMNKLAPEAAALKTDWEVLQRLPVTEAALFHAGLAHWAQGGLSFSPSLAQLSAAAAMTMRMAQSSALDSQRMASQTSTCCCTHSGLNVLCTGLFGDMRQS